MEKTMTSLIILDREEVEKRIAQYKLPENNIEYRKGALYALEWVLSLSKPVETVMDFVGRTFIMMGENSWAYQVEDSAKGTYDVRLTTQEIINKSL